MLQTDRLVLRPYFDSDAEHFAAVNGDPRVGAWVGTLDRTASDALLKRLNDYIHREGFGLWALERKQDNQLIGFCGLQRVKAGALPIGPAIEVGWRLISNAWGRGFATEAASAALAWGFLNLGVAEILAFTSETNAASQAVMRRVGMHPDPSRDFDHPVLEAGHPLRRHVVYVARQDRS